jgi:uncharacterized protein
MPPSKKLMLSEGYLSLPDRAMRIMTGAENADMSLILTAAILLTMVGTAFLSGIFGMAGGLILIGLLLVVMPVPDAMMLHGVTQMASNGWRGLLWIKHVRWSALAPYLAGCLMALVAWSLWRYVPSKAVALLMLGGAPFLVRLVPAQFTPDPESIVQGTLYGIVCMTLLLLTGVSGPLLDSFFLGGKLDRREIIATKAVCQIFGHAAKLLYFGAVIDQAASVDPVVAGLAILASMLGTTFAAKVLHRMSDTQFRIWSRRIITGISGYFVAYGCYVLALSGIH